MCSYINHITEGGSSNQKDYGSGSGLLPQILAGPQTESFQQRQTRRYVLGKDFSMCVFKTEVCLR